MNYTTNFNLNKPEGTDLYNHLTVDNPNMDAIDAAMQVNKLASVGAATELVSGTVHAITRSDSNQNIFKFKATGNYSAGDTITVDGVTVNAYTTGGQQLPDNAYVLSAEVLCILDGTSLWITVNKIPDTDDITYNGNTLTSFLGNLQNLKCVLINATATTGSSTNPMGFYQGFVNIPTAANIDPAKYRGFLPISICTQQWGELCIPLYNNNFVGGAYSAPNTIMSIAGYVIYVD